MPRKVTGRIVRAVTLPLWKRDQLQMRAADAVLSIFGAKKPRRRASVKPALRDRKPAIVGPRTWAGFRSVLCPVDFSRHSRRALRCAAAVALRGKAALLVVYVNDPLLVAAASAGLHDPQFVARSARELKSFINAAIPARTRAQLHLTSRATTGDPADQILREARECGADLIVLGTHGLTGANRLLIGSTTRNVLRRTRVPVLAVPRSFDGRAGVRWSRRIVAALELDASAAKNDAAARIAEWLGASLVRLHDRRGWFSAPRGSMAYQVLSHAVTPVLAYPSHWRPRGPNPPR